MNRSWVTAITLATVAGSGAAFTGVIANSHDAPAKAEALTPVVPEALVRPAVSTTTAPAHTLNYQVGAAGVANLTIGDGTLTVNSATASAGWTLVSSSAPGAHIDVQFSDGTQLVTTAGRGKTFMAGGPRIDTLHAEGTAPRAELLALHRARVALHLAEHPGLQLRPLRSVSEFPGVQDRQRQAKADFRLEHGLGRFEALGVSTDRTELFGPLLRAAALRQVRQAHAAHLQAGAG